jgi:hypothetical protein
VLEHFVDASGALEKMVASLAPGGKLYLELPAQLFDDGVSNEKAWPGGLHNHDHLWLFSERTLRMSLDCPPPVHKFNAAGQSRFGGVF